MLAREFSIVNGEFSNLRCLMNTLYDIQDILWMLMQSWGMMGTDWILVLWTAILPMMLCKLKDYKITGFANFIDEWSQCDFSFTNFGVILEYLESSITTNKAIFSDFPARGPGMYTLSRGILMMGVAPCLLPKISGVDMTPSVTSVESSEQFWRKIRQIWRICEPRINSRNNTSSQTQ